MDHAEAVRAMAAEKYLLNELTTELRDEFEEHFFDCLHCAADVRAGAAFLEHSKLLLAAPVPDAQTVVGASRISTWRWLQPVFTVPALAALFGVILVQSIVVVPGLRKNAAEPHVLASVSLITSATRGGTTSVTTLPAGSSFLLFVDIPPGRQSNSYVADLYSPSGERVWTVPISAEAARDTVTIQVPAGVKIPGMYKLAVRTNGASGSSTEVGSYPFELRFQ